MDRDLTELSFCLYDVSTVNLRQKKGQKSESNSCDTVTILLVEKKRYNQT